MGLDSYICKMKDGKVEDSWKSELFYFRKCWVLHNCMAKIWSSIHPNVKRLMETIEPNILIADTEEKRKIVRRQLYQKGFKKQGEELKQNHENDVYVLIEKSIPNYHLTDFCSFNGEYLELNLGILKEMKKELKPWIDEQYIREKELKVYYKQNPEEGKYEESWDYLDAKRMKRMFKKLKPLLKSGERIFYVGSF